MRLSSEPEALARVPPTTSLRQPRDILIRLCKLASTAAIAAVVKLALADRSFPESLVHSAQASARAMEAVILTGASPPHLYEADLPCWDATKPPFSSFEDSHAPTPGYSGQPLLHSSAHGVALSISDWLKSEAVHQCTASSLPDPDSAQLLRTISQIVAERRNSQVFADSLLENRPASETLATMIGIPICDLRTITIWDAVSWKLPFPTKNGRAKAPRGEIRPMLQHRHARYVMLNYVARAIIKENRPTLLTGNEFAPNDLRSIHIPKYGDRTVDKTTSALERMLALLVAPVVAHERTDSNLYKDLEELLGKFLRLPPNCAGGRQNDQVNLPICGSDTYDRMANRHLAFTRILSIIAGLCISPASEQRAHTMCSTATLLEEMHEQDPEQNSVATPAHSRTRWESKKRRQQTRCASSGTHWEWCSTPESLLRSDPTAALTLRFESLTPMPRWVEFSNAGPINQQYGSKPALATDTLPVLGALFGARTRDQGPRNDVDYSGTGPRTHEGEPMVVNTAPPTLGAMFGARTRNPRSARGGTSGQTRTPSSSPRETLRKDFKPVTGESPRESYYGPPSRIAALPSRPHAIARKENEGARDRRMLKEQKDKVREQKDKVREHEARVKRQAREAKEGRMKRDAQASREI